METPEDAVKAVETRVQQWQELHDVVMPVIREVSSAVQAVNRTIQDETRLQREPLATGTQVMAVDSTKESKWDPVYEGPFTVVQQHAGGSYSLQDATGEVLPSDNNSEHFTVKKITNHRLKHGKYEYLVRWKGWKPEDDFWVKEKDFDDTAIIKKYWKSIAVKKPTKSNKKSAKQKRVIIQDDTIVSGGEICGKVTSTSLGRDADETRYLGRDADETRCLGLAAVARNSQHSSKTVRVFELIEQSGSLEKAPNQ